MLEKLGFLDGLAWKEGLPVEKRFVYNFLRLPAHEHGEFQQNFIGAVMELFFSKI